MSVLRCISRINLQHVKNNSRVIYNLQKISSQYHTESNKFESSNRRNFLLAATGITSAAFAYWLYKNNVDQVDCAELQNSGDEHNVIRWELPFYTKDDVKKHNSLEKGIWVTFGTGVYDITSAIPFHPKNQELLDSAGSAIDKYFDIYDFHKSLKNLGILEKQRIGNLVEEHEIVREDLPFYSKEDVRKHRDEKNGIWVTYGSGVYDITKAIPYHPESPELMALAGESIDALWETDYSFHKSRKILDILEKHRIGNLAPEKEEVKSHQKRRDDLPTFTAEEIRKHDNENTGIWVTYGVGVYDITKFVPQHPGSNNILLGAGGAIDPFWHIYQQHNTAEIRAMLESFRIGNLSAKDETSTKDMDDPWANEPHRHPILKSASKTPYNGEPPLSMLVEHFITPSEFFYVRNHLPVPDVKIEDYELELEVEGSDVSKTLKFDELIKKYPKVEVVAAIMCGGNRRSEMARIKEIKGLSWTAGAVGNAVWAGVRLSDVLKDMGVESDETRHVQFEGLDRDPTYTPYGASIPLSKAMDERADVILAYEMNGRALSRDHGYPIRVIVPGVVGARSVKWLGKITISENESSSHWQQNDYKSFNPSTDWDNVDFTKAPAMQHMPVTSAICSPCPDDTHVKIVDNHVEVRGYAWSGGGNKITRVDLTGDGGKTWHSAELEQMPDGGNVGYNRHFAWTLFTARIPINEDQKVLEVWSKATDSNNNTQPETFKNIWNLRGVCGNAYHRIRINLK